MCTKGIFTLKLFTTNGMQKRTTKKRNKKYKGRKKKMTAWLSPKQEKKIKLSKKKMDRPIQYMFNLFTGSTKPLCSYV